MKIQLGDLKYGGKVKVVGGFYVGFNGVAEGEDVINEKYYIRMNGERDGHVSLHDWIHVDNLEKIK